MSPIEVRSRLRTQPFDPMRVHLSDGSSYDIHRREMAFVTRTDLMIVVQLGADEVPDRLVHCDPVHVARIELIDPDAAR